MCYTTALPLVRPREDGLVKSRTGDETDAETYKNWYQQVYVPVPKTEG